MNSNIVDLSKLYNFAGEDKERIGLIGDSSKGREFGEKAKEICHDTIIDDSGFYIWGKFEKKNRLWRTIYLGQTMKGKTASLKARIIEELKDERMIFWCDKKTDLNNDELKEIIVFLKRRYKNKDYTKNWERSYKKKGATHIIWVSAPHIKSKSKILTVEADLIETMNPSANIKRPKPDSELQKDTIEIIRKMKHLIHKNRP